MCKSGNTSSPKNLRLAEKQDLNRIWYCYCAS